MVILAATLIELFFFALTAGLLVLVDPVFGFSYWQWFGVLIILKLLRVAYVVRRCSLLTASRNNSSQR